jgi:hypothetical protein
MGSSRNSPKTPSGMSGAWWAMLWAGGRSRLSQNDTTQYFTTRLSKVVSQQAVEW